MRTVLNKAALLGGVALFVFVGKTSAWAQTRSFDIPSEDAVKAIPEFARQAGIQILVPSDQLIGVKTPRVKGSFELHAALQKLLAGTGFTITSDDGQTIALSPPPSLGSPRSRPNRLGDARQASSSEVPGAGAEPEEIIVTAQKREERLKDVPVPVTVLNANDLANNGEVLLRDYYSSVPGFSLAPNVIGAQTLSIRGISTGGFENPAVGVTIDDVPFGSSTGFSSGNDIPNVDPGDLARVEVLRGPQGTLYGANSMGGLLKFVTVDPSTDRYSGRVEAGFNSVYNGAEPGFDVRASANIPLGETLALRVSGFKRQDAGYIDNPVLNLKGTNEAEADGARVSMLWRPFEGFTAKFTALYQYYKLNGPSDVITGFVQLQNNYIPNNVGDDRTIQAYSLTLKAGVGDADLTSITGYNVNSHYTTADDTSALGAATKAAFGVPGDVYFNKENFSEVTQELRLSVPIWENFDWLIGAFYMHQAAPQVSGFWAENPLTGQIVGAYWHADSGTVTLGEYAAFTDVTYKITDQLDVQIGARETHIDQMMPTTVQTGPLVQPTPQSPPLIVPATTSSAYAFTYLLTPRFKVSPDLMIYARLASGYRPGGSNNPFAGGAPAPQYAPDKTEDYEIGVKGDLFDHKLSFDASLYYIDWKNLQIEVRNPSNVPYTANGSGAKSEGLELSAEARPLTGLTIAGWFDYDNAVLTQSFPANSTAYGVAGNRLPNSSRVSGHFSLEEDFPLWDELNGFVGVAVSYVGDRKGLFLTTPQRQNYPSYTRTDLRAGLHYESWTFNIYINNLADTRGVLSGGPGYFVPTAFDYITPRTIGVSLSKTF